MQTFLPSKDFKESAKILDNKRLGKQRVEVYQILRAMTGKTKGWTNHPATKMWRGYQTSLAMYGWYMCEEWKYRGFNDTLTEKIVKFIDAHDLKRGQYDDPPWLGDPDFHAAHRSNLLRKDAKFYKKYKWKEPNDLPYVWPETK